MGAFVRRLRGAAPIAVAAVLLAGCGGSGSSGPAPATPSPAPPTPVPAAPASPAPTKAEAYRFLNQATFGATEAEAQRLIALASGGNAYSRWIDEQLAVAASLELPYVVAAVPNPVPADFNVGSLNTQRQDVWFQNAVRGSDQLRQRVAWALSQTMVVSQVTLTNYPFGLASYYDTLARDAFGDFRKLIEDVTLHPMMGVYLSMLGNQKPNPARNIRPDENYARELMQLFTIGLVQLNPDGTIQRDALNEPIPTYDQAVIEGFAHVFTGWKWACTTGSPAGCNFNNTRATAANQVVPMQAFTDQHATGAKRLLSYATAAKSSLPANQSPAQDLADALDNIFNHPNVGPFLARGLIQKLVTSNPSAGYVQRVSGVFDNDGTGRRGNLTAVVRAILLDDEARGTSISETSGKVKEPLLRLTQLWRAYGGAAPSGKYVNVNAQTNFGEGPLTAGSVFNFFSPFYAPPGEIADRGLVAPELQIATEYQNTLIANYFYVQLFNRSSPNITAGPDTIVTHLESEVALAADPAALVTAVGQKLLAGLISDTLRAQAEQQVVRVAATNAQQRAAEAIWLIATSPEYAVQR
jgi:uncharacterized protein (DUF1800 family)